MHLCRKLMFIQIAEENNVFTQKWPGISCSCCQINASLCVFFLKSECKRITTRYCCQLELSYYSGSAIVISGLVNVNLL